MQHIMPTMVNFVTEAQFSDLPEAVVHETKRLLLDSLGCAIGGLSTNRGRLSTEFARRLGGPSESSIAGTGDKVSCANAAFANGELINSQDYDAIVIGHVPPIVVPAALATAECAEATGRDLILATALGLEIAARMMSALTSLWEVVPDRNEPPKAKLLWSPSYGYAPSIFGAAAGAGKIMKLDHEKVANALGIAGYISPVSPFKKWTATLPAP